MTDGKAFCLRLLLMCCNLNIDDWKGLIPAHCVPIDFDKADEPVPPRNSLNPSIAKGRITRFQAREIKERSKNYGASEEKEHDASCGTFGCEEEEWLVDIADMLRWEARCLGYSYLGEDELHQHNITML